MLHPNPSKTRTMMNSISRAVQTSRLCNVPNVIECEQKKLKTVDSSALQLFRDFQLSSTDPDKFTISKALSVSANLYSSNVGRQIHTFLLKSNVPMDIAASNSLINFYFKFGSVVDAERVVYAMPKRDMYTWTVVISGYASNGRLNKAMALFKEMPRKNTVSWNSMIGAYQKEGHDDVALELFRRMRREYETPNDVTCLTVLKACIGLHRLEQGREVHGYIVKSAWIKSSIVACTLMDMYAKCGHMPDASKSFEEISEHDVVSWSILLASFAQNGKIVEAEGVFSRMPEKNIVTWNAMVSGYVQNDMQESGFSLSVQMMKDGMRPNCFTMTSLLSGCSFSRYAKEGKMFHGYVMKAGLNLDTTIANSMITMYGEQGNIGDACVVFDEMPCYDVVSWTAMLAAYVSNNDVDQARCIFDGMPEKNLISWNTMMFGYLQCRRSMETMTNTSYTADDAIMFFCDMERSEIKSDHFSYNCALTACGGNQALDQVSAIHCRAMKRGLESDVGVGNALISVYGKCGSIDKAEKVFNQMTNHDMISWNALLTGYSQNGRGHDVLEFYKEMQNSGLEPNHVTFISLLSSCSHMGEVKQGLEYFDTMEKVYGIIPNREHYACLVDILGRAGLLHEAESIIRKMPIEPDTTVWGALLGACKMHGDPVIGKRSADEIFRLEPDNSSAHVALAETFAASKMWEDVAEVRSVIRGKRLLKDPGCSWINVRNQNHMFLSGDLCHLRNDFIHSTLSNLYNNMMEEEFLFLYSATNRVWRLKGKSWT